MYVEQIAIESTILPLALHFEPIEIAVACIGLASNQFSNSFSSYKVPGFHDDIKYVNALGKHDMTGNQLFKKHFKNVKFPEMNIERTYMGLESK